MNDIENFNLGIDDISDEGIDFDQFENDIAQEEENANFLTNNGAAVRLNLMLKVMQGLMILSKFIFNKSVKYLCYLKKKNWKLQEKLKKKIANFQEKFLLMQTCVW